MKLNWWQSILVFPFALIIAIVVHIVLLPLEVISTIKKMYNKIEEQ